MTNTLHRYGDAPSFEDDYVVIAIPSKGKNDENSLPKLRKFLEMAIPFHPVNLGDARHGGALRPCKSLNPTVHWKRDSSPSFDDVIDGMDTPTTVAAVFDNGSAAENFVRAVVEADLGLSVNISTSIELAKRCCDFASTCRHSVGYSLGFEGRTERLPSEDVLTLSTMCGHGMVSASFATKMIDWVKEGRRTPNEAASYMARFCSCGVFNVSRATRVLQSARSVTH